MNSKTEIDLHKPISEYTEEEIKKFFFDVFDWVVKNRIEWLEEIVKLQKLKVVRVAS